MGSRLRIVQPGEESLVGGVQQSFGFGASDLHIKNSYPRVYRDVEGFRKVLYDTSKGENYKDLGYDLEFNDYRVTVIGIASTTEAASLPWDSRLAEEMIEVVQRRNARLVCYSAFGAEKHETEKALGRRLPLNLFHDSMEAFYLLHQAFAKSGDRSEEEEDAGSLGFFNLWTCASIYTTLSMWKSCRGADCPAAAGYAFPCPRHGVFEYNGIDALAGIVAFYNMRRELDKRGIPWSLYLERLELAYICQEMESRGIARDAEYMQKLQDNILAYKARLFPHVLDARGNPVYTEFNPMAPAQVTAWFGNNGVNLKSSEKAVVIKALEERARKKLGVMAAEKQTIGQALAAYDGEIDPVTKRLWDLYNYKGAGKGTDAWLAQRYFGKDGFLHPRFPTTGTQTTRLSSSKPNFQNIPARGWGAIFRGGITVRDPKEHVWGKADNSQLELRSCLWQAGVDVTQIKGDAFDWLVEKSNGGFDKASAILQQAPRQSAKSFAHGANYGEGIILVEGSDLESSRRQSEIRSGALIVNHPKYGRPLWEFRGQVVCFTGANVAERLFGSKTFENRKKALDLQAIYFDSFKEIPAWHRKTLDALNDSSFVRYPSGHSLEVVGQDVDVAKAAIAALGQGVGAVYVMANVCRLWRETGQIPYLVVHDEINLELPRGITDDELLDTYRFMSRSHENLLPGFMAPAGVYVGESWMEDSRDVPEEFKSRCLRKVGKV